MSKLYENKTRLTADHEIPEKIILQNLIFGMIHKMTVEDLKRIFNFELLDPNKIDEAFESLKEAKGPDEYERKERQLHYLLMLKDQHQKEARISITL